MPRWLSRTLIGIASFVVSMLVAAAAFLAFIPSIDLLAIPGDLLNYLSGEPLGGMGKFYLATVAQFAKFAAPFALIAAVMGEMKSYRSWSYYTLCGAGLAVLGYLIWQESRAAPTGSSSDDFNLLAYAAFVIAGAIGGLVYWYLAGSRAGSAPFLGSRPSASIRSPQTPSRPLGSSKTGSDRDSKNRSASVRS